MEAGGRTKREQHIRATCLARDIPAGNQAAPLAGNQDTMSAFVRT
jgi:hypothetical protein